MHLVNTLSFGLLWTNLSTGAMGVMMGLMAKGTDIGVAFASHNFFKIGQDLVGVFIVQRRGRSHLGDGGMGLF